MRGSLPLNAGGDNANDPTFSAIRARLPRGAGRAAGGRFGLRHAVPSPLRRTEETDENSDALDGWLDAGRGGPRGGIDGGLPRRLRRGPEAGRTEDRGGEDPLRPRTVAREQHLLLQADRPRAGDGQ